MINKRYYWLKLDQDFFKQKELKEMRDEHGSEAVLIYMKIMLLSIGNGGRIVFDIESDSFEKMLADAISEKTERVIEAFDYLLKAKLIERTDDEIVTVSHALGKIGSESESASRVRKHRKGKASIKNNEIDMFQKEQVILYTSERYNVTNERYNVTSERYIVTDDKKQKSVDKSEKLLKYNEDIEEIFEFWKGVMRHKGAKLDDNRKRRTRDALKMGYSVQDLKDAITGCSRTPHNIGKNSQGQRYDGLNIIFKSADQIDRFIRNKQAVIIEGNTGYAKTARNLQESGLTLEEWLPD